MIKSASRVVLIAITILSASNAYKLESRILGGTSSTESQFPYYAFLTIFTERGIEVCGGTLLNDEYILTAAHCVLQAEKIIAILGSWKILETEENRKAYTINRNDIIPHNNFSYKTRENDIALLELPHSIEFNERIRPVNLSMSCDKTENLDAIVIGNGATDAKVKEEIASVLQWAPLKTTSTQTCKKNYPILNHGKSFCAQGKEGRAACYGN